MKLTEHLLSEHAAFRLALGRLDELATYPKKIGDPAAVRQMVRELNHALALHAWAEDVFLYPALRGIFPASNDARIDARYLHHLEEEHAHIDGHAARFEQEVSAVPLVWSWPQTFALFFQGLNVHMRKEERELFPYAEARLGEARLQALFSEMSARRAEAPR